MNKKLLILGAGMFGTVVKEIAEETKAFEQIDFIDDTFGSKNLERNCHEHIIGKLEDYHKFAADYGYAIVSIGNPQVRKEWTKKLGDAGYSIPSIVSTRSYVSPSARIGTGVVIAPMAVINPNACVGNGSFITAGAIVDHNSLVQDYCNIQCGTVVMPSAAVPSFTKTQPNEVVRKNGFSFTLGNHNGESVFVSERMEITTDGNIEG